LHKFHFGDQPFRPQPVLERTGISQQLSFVYAVTVEQSDLFEFEEACAIT
jgi:hypothetical protein